MTAEDLALAQYVAVTTFRKDGTPVATPVWIAPFGEDELAVISLADAWKVKRVRRDPRVRLQACDVRGRVRRDAPAYEARGRVAEADELRRVRGAMSRKYLMARVGNTVEDVLGRLAIRKPRAGIVISEIRLLPGG